MRSDPKLPNQRIPTRVPDRRSLVQNLPRIPTNRWIDPIRVNLGKTHTEELSSRALSASSRARARYRYRCRVSGVFVEVDLIGGVCSATMQSWWFSPSPISFPSSTMMRLPITITVTGTGSKDPTMCLRDRIVSSRAGVSITFARMGINPAPTYFVVGAGYIPPFRVLKPN